MSSEKLEQLLAEFIERRDAGEALDAAAFCGEHAEAGDELREALLELVGTDAMLPGDNLHPEKIGPWRVVAPLNRGGMGSVLRVVREGTEGPELALKLLSDTSFASPRARERLQREGEALKTLDHPGIVRCHEVGFAGELPYLVMDLVQGQSLAEIVGAARARGARELNLGPGEDGRFERIATVVGVLARSVAALHHAGLLHRDIKPANVVFDETTGKPVLLDFGLVGGDELATLTRSGDVVGTPAYMAPEQARGEHVGPAADVFGVGAVLFELLTLGPPRHGEGSWSVLEEVRSRPVPRLQRLEPGVPAPLARIADKALAWHPRYRYPTVEQLACDLEAFASGQNPQASGRGPGQRAAELWEFRRGQVLGVAAFLVIAPLVWLALDREADPQRVATSVARVLDAVIDDQDEARQAAVRQLADVAPGHALTRVVPAVDAEATPAAFSDYDKALLEGLRLLRAGKPREAAVPLERAAQLDQKGAAAVLLHGCAAMRGGNEARARRELAAATRLLPRSRSAHRMLGRVLRRLGKLDEAELALARAFELGEPDVALFSERSRLHRARQRYQQGLADAERGLALAGALPPRELLNMKGVLLDQLDRRSEATAVFQELAKRFPDYVAALFNQGFVADRECRLEDARRLYDQAIRIDKKSISALMNLAWLHSGSNRANCAKCKAAFDAAPKLLDEDLAEEFNLRGVRASLGRSGKVLQQAIATARQLGRTDRLRKLMVELRDRRGISNSRYGRLGRAIMSLDR